MAVVEAILAVIGLLFLLLLIVTVLDRDKPEVATPPAEADLAAPYREGLHAAVHLQRSAQDLEAQIWAEAARHAGTDISTGVSDAEPQR